MDNLADRLADIIIFDDSSAGILSPVPGSGLWETDVESVNSDCIDYIIMMV